jgi:hypothetical protein
MRIPSNIPAEGQNASPHFNDVDSVPPEPSLVVSVHATPHPGTDIILKHLRHPEDIIAEAAEFVYDYLYGEHISDYAQLYPIRKIADRPDGQVAAKNKVLNLVPKEILGFKDRKKHEIKFFIRPFEGVAHTCNPTPETAEIHLSSSYFLTFATKKPTRSYSALKHELYGVIFHEMVHAYQFNCDGTAPGGLLEGIADLVRLRAGFAPPHWQRKPTKRPWDAGYDITAYFLDWIESATPIPAFGKLLNQGMSVGKWSPDIVEDLTGLSLDTLWQIYQQDLET